MIFDTELAKKLQPLLHPDVETAILLLLDTTLKQAEESQDDPTATDAQLRQFQGKKMLIKELKQYRIRLNDAVKRNIDDATRPN